MQAADKTSDQESEVVAICFAEAGGTGMAEGGKGRGSAEEVGGCTGALAEAERQCRSSGDAHNWCRSRQWRQASASSGCVGGGSEVIEEEEE